MRGPKQRVVNLDDGPFDLLARRTRFSLGRHVSRRQLFEHSRPNLGGLHIVELRLGQLVEPQLPFAQLRPVTAHAMLLQKLADFGRAEPAADQTECGNRQGSSSQTVHERAPENRSRRARVSHLTPLIDARPEPIIVTRRSRRRRICRGGDVFPSCKSSAATSSVRTAAGREPRRTRRTRATETR